VCVRKEDKEFEVGDPARKLGRKAQNAWEKYATRR
jgi:hypothetical protein